ncbi:MAG: hypothetical protein M1817_004296 [Caeruleum heppii]|nr:MAG: hypothetical protein M1817_004296 [Caeruleum heppii]
MSAGQLPRGPPKSTEERRKVNRPRAGTGPRIRGFGHRPAKMEGGGAQEPLGSRAGRWSMGVDAGSRPDGDVTSGWSHLRRKTPLADTNVRKQMMKCHRCGEMGHYARQCPSYVSARPENEAQKSRRTSSLHSSDASQSQRVWKSRSLDGSSLESKPSRMSPAQRPIDARRAAERAIFSERISTAERSVEPSDPDPEPSSLPSFIPPAPVAPVDDWDTPSRRRRTDEGASWHVKDRRRGLELGSPVADDHRGRRDDRKRRSKGRGRNADDEEYGDVEARRERKARRARERALQKETGPPTPIVIPQFISVGNLANILKVKGEAFEQKLDQLGFNETSHDHVLNAETAGLIAMEYNFEPIINHESERDLYARPVPEDKSVFPPRPPVVTIMGHVDHGKTTLLDWLRKSSIAASEHGGITQHIGAFSVKMPTGKLITFLDTPGHEAFLSMRQRGANVTDIVILVVAADDSVMPQTIEAIKHAKAAKVPMIVAVNKIDKGDANVPRVQQDLARHGVEVEDIGGDTQVVPVSGKTGQGMDELEEATVTLSEILDMRAEKEGAAEGWIVEATTKKAGRVATVLVRRGTLRPGDVVVAGSTWSRVKTLKDENGVEVDSVGPGMPAEVDGWREQPAAGEEMLQASDEGQARSVVDYRIEQAERIKMSKDVAAVNEQRRLKQEQREREEHLAKGVNPSEDAEDRTTKPSGITEVGLILKADVSGSVEAILNSISALGNAEVRPLILRSGVGPVSESDLSYAAASGATVVNFNSPLDPSMSHLAESLAVKVVNENIIYRLVDEVKALLEGHLKPLITQRVLGEAEVAQVFSIAVKGKKGGRMIAGCKMRNGVVARNARVRVLRGKEIVHDGTLSSLKNIKKDIDEARKGGECGMAFEGWEGVQVGDQVQAFEEKAEKRFL